MVGLQPGSSARTAILPIGAGRLFVRDVGNGPPIVVVHGGPGFDHEYLLPELDGLAEQFRLVYYDQRGRGRSFAGEGGDDVTIAGEIEDLDRIREWAGAESVALLGHSWGGLLAMEYAIRHPDRVSHLTLLNTAPVSHQDMLALRREWNARRSPEQSARIRELRSDPAYLAGRIDADAEFNRIHFGSTVRRPDQLEEVVRRLRIGFTPEGVVAATAIEDALYDQTLLAEDYDLIPELRALRIPTLVIRGENDFIPLDGVRRIVSAIPGSRFVQIPDCGHFTFLERPELVRSTIAEFLGAATIAGCSPPPA
jgi:proline iminopeptidase